MFPSWKALLLIATLPNLITIVLYKWVPESPSWLLCKGKTEEAEEILTFMAKVNRRDPTVSSIKVKWSDRILHQKNNFCLREACIIRNNTVIFPM